MGAIPKPRQLQERSYAILRAIYTEFTGPYPQERGDFHDEVLSGIININENAIGHTRRLFQSLGIMTSRVEYPGQMRGRVSYWTILVDQPKAYRLLDAHFNSGGEWRLPEIKRPKVVEEVEPVTVTLSDDEEVKAIAGPEPETPMAVLSPLRKDEGAALVEAARQLRAKGEAIKQATKVLLEAGITVDVDALANAITPGLSAEQVARLAPVVDLLDYIDRLEADRNRLGQLSTENRELRAKVGELTGQNNTLTAANRRMSERMAQSHVAPSPS